MWEDAGGVLHLHGWREALLWGICRSSDDLARVPSTFTTRLQPDLTPPYRLSVYVYFISGLAL